MKKCCSVATQRDLGVSANFNWNDNYELRASKALRAKLSTSSKEMSQKYSPKRIKAALCQLSHTTPRSTIQTEVICKILISCK